MKLALPLVAVASMVSGAHAVGCELTYAGGRRYQLNVSADKANVLLLDHEGYILHEVEVQDGQVFKFKGSTGKSSKGGSEYEIEQRPDYWYVESPNVLFRAETSESSITEQAYCSPNTVIRIDRPDDLTIVSSTASKSRSIHLIVGATKVEPSSIGIELDCVDIMNVTSASFPGGPYSGVASIESTDVIIEDLEADLEKNAISFSILGLPPGSHYVRVMGEPISNSKSKKGTTKENRGPKGGKNKGNRRLKKGKGKEVSTERVMPVFSIDITEPTDGSNLPLGPTTSRGHVVHGLPIKSIRVDGSDVPLPPLQVTNATECLGESFEADFEVTLPMSNLNQDFHSGNDQLSALDQGVNFISALANDFESHSCNDRVRVTVGDVKSVSSGSRLLNDEKTCDPMDEVPGFVTDGFSISLTEAGLQVILRDRLLDTIKTGVSNELNALNGQSLNEMVNPCSRRRRNLNLNTNTNRGQRHNQQGKQDRSNSDFESRLRRKLNEPPVFDPIEDQTVGVFEEAAVFLQATDPENDPITFAGVSLPANAGISDDNVFRFVPDCSQIGDNAVTISASDDQGNTAQTSFNVKASVQDIPVDVEFRSAPSFDPNSMDIQVALADENKVNIMISMGQVVFHMEAKECRGGCSCLEYTADFDIKMSSVTLSTTLTPHQLLCGISDASELDDTSVDITGLEVDEVDSGGSGICYWLIGALTGFVVQILDVFKVDDLILEDIVGPYIATYMERPLEEELENQFGSLDQFDLPGLHTLEFSQDLPESVPLTLSTKFSDVPTILPSTAMSMGIHTNFVPKNPQDPSPPWVPTQSGIPNAGSIGSDIVVSMSDDALNQMMSSLVATSLLRQTLTDLTLADVGLTLPFVPTDQAIWLTTEFAQDAEGNGIPPVVGFVDDPATAGVTEIKVRVQPVVRIIVPRGVATSPSNDRELCACTDFTLQCLAEPCLLLESVLKLNLLTDVSLTVSAAMDATIQITVTEIQELARRPGFDSYEAHDFEDEEEEIVNTSAQSPLLNLLRATINGFIPPFQIPHDAMTLGGTITPTNVNLFTATVDDAGLGDQDYFGIKADLA